MKVIGTHYEIENIMNKCKQIDDCDDCILSDYCDSECFKVRNDKDTIKMESILITKKGDKHNE